MKYQIVLDDNFILYDLRDRELIVEDPELDLKVSKIGKLTFSINKEHPYFNYIEKKLSKINVFKNGKTIFRGRVISDEQDLYNNKSILCESALSYLNDSIIRPNSFKGTPEEFFRMIINYHNSQVSDNQKIKIGIVTVTDPNNYITRSWEDYIYSWELLEKRGVNLLGGYLVERYEDDGTYLDWVADFDETSTQNIEFGENIIDILAKNDASSTYSVIVPLGAEIEKEDGTKERLTIESVNDGKDYLINQNAYNKYGWVVAPISKTKWDDVTIPANLKTKGESFLNNQAIMMATSLEITALDLQATNSNIDSFFIYQYVNVISTIHNISKKFLLNHIVIPLAHPENTQITVGETTSTLTGIEISNINKIGNIEKDFEINKAKVEQIDKSVDELVKINEIFTTEIGQTEEAIKLAADGLRDLSGYIREVEGTNSITLSDTGKSDGYVKKLVITGFTELGLYPGMVYPSDNIHPGVLKNYCLVISGNGETNEIYINLEEPLTGNDELIIEDNKLYVKKDGITSFKSQIISLKTYDGETTYSIKYFDNLSFYCKYMIKNSITESFATKSEANALFEVTNEIIKGKVSRDELEAELNILSNEINAKVSDDDLNAQVQILSNNINSKVSKGNVVNEINQSLEETKINANRISLNGYISNSSRNFEITEEGKAKFVDVTITGGDINLPSGGKVIGGDGILTNLQYSSVGQFEGFTQLGFGADYLNGNVQFYNKDICIDVDIPSNFKVVSAYLTLYHTPALWNYWNDTSGSVDVWGYPRNLKLYKASADSQNYSFKMSMGGDYSTSLGSISLSEISNAFGSTTYTPTNTSGSSVVVKKSIDIKDYLTSGSTHKLIVRSSDSVPSDEGTACNKTGIARAVVNIIGYMSF